MLQQLLLDGRLQPFGHSPCVTSPKQTLVFLSLNVATMHVWCKCVFHFDSFKMYHRPALLAYKAGQCYKTGSCKINVPKLRWVSRHLGRRLCFFIRTVIRNCSCVAFVLISCANLNCMTVRRKKKNITLRNGSGTICNQFAAQLVLPGHHYCEHRSLSTSIETILVRDTGAHRMPDWVLWPSDSWEWGQWPSSQLSFHLNNTIHRINNNIQQHHTITSSAGAQRLIPMAALILPPKKTTLCHQAGGLHASHANKQPSIVPTVPTMLFCLLSWAV